MTGRLSGKVAAVTGGASGIGKATAKLLAAEGADVAIMDLTPVLALEGANRFLGIQVDLRESEKVEPALERVIRELGRCDILINCAGESTGLSLAETELADWERIYKVNVTAPMLLMKAFARHAKQRGGGGRIVNIISSSAYRAQRSPPAYGVAKAALAHLTRIVAAELGLDDVNVNGVAPGLTATPMALAVGDRAGLKQVVSTDGALGNFLHRVSEPEDVAEAILFLCLPASSQITGQIIHTSAGAVV